MKLVRITTIALLLSASAAAADEAGMRAHVDPVTGRFAEPPADAGTQARTGRPRRAMPQVLPGTSPAGGYEVRLDDRFVNAMVAVEGANGRTEVDCHHGSEKAAK